MPWEIFYRPPCINPRFGCLLEILASTYGPYRPGPFIIWKNVFTLEYSSRLLMFQDHKVLMVQDQLWYWTVEAKRSKKHLGPSKICVIHTPHCFEISLFYGRVLALRHLKYSKKISKPPDMLFPLLSYFQHSNPLFSYFVPSNPHLFRPVGEKW